MSALESSNMAMKDTRDERSLGNYQRYLDEWDKYETKIRDHFAKKEIDKFGSEQEARKAHALYSL
jgi:hypothetical protein